LTRCANTIGRHRNCRRISPISKLIASTAFEFFPTGGCTRLITIALRTHPIRSSTRAAAFAQDRLAVFRGVLNAAYAAGLVVDVSFAHETVAGLSVPSYGSAIQAVTANLAGSYPLVFFDIQNERDIMDARYVSQPDVLTIRNMIKGTDPNRIVTASDTGASGTYGTKQFYFDAQLDLVTYHDPRDPHWWDDLTAAVVQDLWYDIQPWHPVYLQEPQKWELDSTDWHYMVAADTAKRYGAAGWTLHAANPGFRLEGRNFRDHLYAEQIGILEWYRDTLPLTGWSACNFYASPTYQAVPTTGGDFAIYFSTRWGCSSAAFVDPSASWVHITGPGTQHTYDGYYYFHVDSSGGAVRDTTIWVADQRITVHQG
jgi:hypothetical protein